MKGLIVLDGPDGAGKTTLAKRLCERYQGKYFHLTYRWKKSMFEYHTAALHHALSLADKQLVIIDRLWMSEVIYATVYRGGSQWPHMGRMMDRVIRKHAGMYVLCFDESMKSHQDRFMKLKESREEMYSDTSDVWALYYSLYHGGVPVGFGADYYADLASGEGLKLRGDVWKYSIDNEGRDMEGYIDRLMTCMELRQKESILPDPQSKFTNFLGYAPEAKYLFVGDKLSDQRYRALSWPFYAYQLSSLHLTQQLSLIGFDETEACWTNINEPMGVDYLIWAVECHGIKQVLCFGREALRTVQQHSKDLKIRIEVTSHPSWHRRFKAGHDTLAAEIKGAFTQFELHPRKDNDDANR